MCDRDDVCFYYNLLKKHNDELKKKLLYYIPILESYICILTNIQSHGINKFDHKLIDISDELYNLIKSLISSHCEKCCDTPIIGLGVYLLHVRSKCRKYKYSFKRQNMACIATYCKPDGTVGYLKYKDILNLEGENMDEKINKLIGFKRFFQHLVDIIII